MAMDLESSVYSHKTAAAFKWQVLPVVAVLPGVSGLVWAGPWLQNRQAHGLRASKAVPFQPAPLAWGGWAAVPFDACHGAIWLRESGLPRGRILRRQWGWRRFSDSQSACFPVNDTRVGHSPTDYSDPSQLAEAFACTVDEPCERDILELISLLPTEVPARGAMQAGAHSFTTGAFSKAGELIENVSRLLTSFMHSPPGFSRSVPPGERCV